MQSDASTSGSTFDGNAIAAEVITDLTRDFITRAKEAIGRAVRKNILVKLETFERYVQRTYNRCSGVRVILDKDRVYDLKDVYVEGRYSVGEKIITDNEIASMLREGANIVVQGFGGIGKTILLKHLWLSVFDEPAGKIPVFIELKRMNDISSVRMAAYLRATLTDGDPGFLEEDFDTLANLGRFIFLFDAFDEVNDDKRDEVEREILKLAYRYPKCGIAVSSRKDNRFYSWEQFAVAHAVPFDKHQITSVIKKVDFDPIVRKKFLEKVVGDSYEEFSDFLSTPLLALMMLLMYRQFADVPEKIHIFYRYAFQTLYSLHDAGKESFTRQRKTSLNEDDFAKIFSLFSLMSYISMSNTFELSALRSLINAAKTRASIEVDVDAFISEAVESVNLLYQEGDMISFVHRSFQEYFSAFAIVNFFSNKLPEVYNKLPRRNDDSVLMMSYEMNRDVVEENYILPQYRRFKSFYEEVLSFDRVDLDLMVKVRARWLLIIIPGKKLEILREGVYSNSEAMYFSSSVAMSVSRGPAFREGDLGLEGASDQSIRTLAREIVSRLPASSMKARHSLVVIIDFEGRSVSYDDVDGMRSTLSGEDYEAISARALQCKTYLDGCRERWRASIQNLQRTMRDIVRREQTRAVTLNALDGL